MADLSSHELEVSVVSADEYGNGVAAAHLMAQALDGKGEVGLVFHAADFNVTRQRYKAVKATFAEDYPGIKIIAEQGIGGPDFSGDGEKAASAMLTEHPRIKGIWAVWDVPAEGVISAARNAGRDDLVITTMGRVLSEAPEMVLPKPFFSRQSASSSAGSSSIWNEKRSSTSSRSLGKSMSALSTSSISTTQRFC